MSVSNEATTAALAVWWAGRAEQHPSHRARMRAAIEAALPHLGLVVGRADGEATMLGESISYPADYEIWRDAWNLAVGRVGNLLDREDLPELAEWFWERLQEVPLRHIEDEHAAGEMAINSPAANGGTADAGGDPWTTGPF